MKPDTTMPSNLVELNESQAPLSVFCVHLVGGGLKAFEPLAKKLAATAKFYGLEDPYIYGDKTYSSVPELAELHIEAIRSVQPYGPYVLSGFCACGAVAYEIACQLSMEGEQVAKLVLLGTHDVAGFDPAEEGRYLFLQRYLEGRFGFELRHLDWAAFERMTRGDVCAAIADELVVKRMLPDQRGGEWVQKSLESICMTRAATKVYKPPKSRFDIDLFTRPLSKESLLRMRKDWGKLDELASGNLNIIEPHSSLKVGEFLETESSINEVVGELQRTSLALTLEQSIPA